MQFTADDVGRCAIEFYRVDDWCIRTTKSDTIASAIFRDTDNSNGCAFVVHQMIDTIYRNDYNRSRKLQLKKKEKRCFDLSVLLKVRRCDFFQQQQHKVCRIF